MSGYSILSKTLAPLLVPGNFLLLLIVAGLIGTVFTRARWAKSSIWLGAFGLLFSAVFPGGGALTSVLENRFPQPAMPAHLDGIVVLGGSIQTGLSVARTQPTLNDNAERDLIFVTLAHRYPTARLVFSGGTGKLFPDGTTEAAVAKTMYVGLGIEEGRLLLEDRSRDTWENAVFSRELVQPKVEEVWLLVTSARHMPRAVGAFRQVNWDVLPYPVDYRTAGEVGLDLGFNLGTGLRGLGEAFHEWIGLAVYFALGRSRELFPGPL